MRKGTRGANYDRGAYLRRLNELVTSGMTRKDAAAQYRLEKRAKMDTPTRKPKKRRAYGKRKVEWTPQTLADEALKIVAKLELELHELDVRRDEIIEDLKRMQAMTNTIGVVVGHLSLPEGDYTNPQEPKKFDVADLPLPINPPGFAMQHVKSIREPRSYRSRSDEPHVVHGGRPMGDYTNPQELPSDLPNNCHPDPADGDDDGKAERDFQGGNLIAEGDWKAKADAVEADPRTKKQREEWHKAACKDMNETLPQRDDADNFGDDGGPAAGDDEAT